MQLKFVVIFLLCYSTANATCTSPCVAATTFAATSGSVTSPAINTTGATLLVVTANCFVCYSTNSTTAPTDNKSNTTRWLVTGLFNAGSNFGNTMIWYFWNPNVGAGHTITWNAGGTTFAGVTFAAYSGVQISSNPLDQVSAGSAGAATTCSPGSITPSSSTELIVTVLSPGSLTSSYLINSSFTISGTIAFNSSVNFPEATAYRLASAAVNPQWSWTGSQAAPCTMASFFQAPTSNQNKSHLIR